MKKKIFISVLLLFVASLCFADLQFNSSPSIQYVGIMSKKEFNDYVIRGQENLKMKK